MHATAEPETRLPSGLHVVREQGHAGKHRTGPGSLETEARAPEDSLSQQAARVCSGQL